MTATNRPPEGQPGWTSEELDRLLNTLADGRLTGREEKRLNEMLARSGQARQQFREFAALHAGLYWDYATLVAPAPPASAAAADAAIEWLPADHLAGSRQTVPPPDAVTGNPETPRRLWGLPKRAVCHPPSRPRATGGFSHRQRAVGFAVAAVATVSLFAWLASVASQRPATDPRPLATVTKTRFLLSGDPTVPLEIGQPLHAGIVQLLGGAVELTLRNGVVITLEGPGTLDLQGELQAFLHRGNATVRMPGGMDGFRLATPSTDILDLGTEFAVMAGPNAVTDVQVFDGEVIATGRGQGSSRFPRRLTAGEAMRFSADGATEPAAIGWQPRRFVRRLAATVGTPDPGQLDQDDPKALEDDFRVFGRPGQRAFLTVVRTRGPIVIDGKLGDWQEAAGFSTAGDRSPAAAEWVDGRLMYDDRYFYIAAHVGDPFPLRNACDPQVNPFFGWRGGGLQVRLSTDRQLGWPATGNDPGYFAKRQETPTAAEIAAADNPRLNHLTMWYHAASDTPCLTVSHGMDTDTLTVNPEGFRAAYQLDTDGRGYVAEYAIPWTLLNCADDPPQPGDVLAITWQTMWGDENGLLERDRLYECRNPIEPRRIFVWERAATWGRAEYQ